MIILLYFALCSCVGLFAHYRRNRNGFGWSVLSIVISPLIGGLVVAILPSQDGLPWWNRPVVPWFPKDAPSAAARRREDIVGSALVLAVPVGMLVLAAFVSH